jgi:hypothetical protein
LTNHSAVPFEAEAFEGPHDAVRGARDLAGPIEILDAQQPAAAARPRIEKAGGRRIERPQMQIARWGRGEAAYVAAGR